MTDEGAVALTVILIVLLGMIVWGLVYTARLEKRVREEEKRQIAQITCDHDEVDWNDKTEDWVCRKCGKPGVVVDG
jgi:hypothetical protein